MSDVDLYEDQLVIEDADTDDEGNVVALPRVDLDRYRRWLAQTPVGKKGAAPIDTGEIVPDYKIDKDGNQVLDDDGKPIMNVNRGKGKGELEAIRGLRTIADQEYNLGIDVRTQQLANGKTMVRWSMRPKRTYTEQQNADREAARKKGLLRRAEKRAATLAAAAHKAPQDAKAQEALAKARATVEKLKKEAAAAQTPQTPPAKAPAAQKAAPARS